MKTPVSRVTQKHSFPFFLPQNPSYISLKCRFKLCDVERTQDSGGGGVEENSRNSDQLSNLPQTGMTVSTAKDGLGMLIRSVIQGGSISRDGRLGVGDLILAINGEPTAHLTNVQARAMLRRHSLVGPDMG